MPEVSQNTAAVWGRNACSDTLPNCREATPVETGTKSAPGLSCYSGNMTAVHASPPEPGTKPNYPFAEWLNGNKWTLTRGRDYWGPTDQFIRQLRGSANARGVGVDLIVEDCGRYVMVIPRG